LEVATIELSGSCKGRLRFNRENRSECDFEFNDSFAIASDLRSRELSHRPPSSFRENWMQNDFGSERSGIRMRLLGRGTEHISVNPKNTPQNYPIDQDEKVIPPFDHAKIAHSLFPGTGQQLKATGNQSVFYF
jgi:hypothetical protein